VVFTWRILLFVFLHGLLAVPPEDMNLEDAPLYYLRASPIVRKELW
jgi:hypothetical protein